MHISDSMNSSENIDANSSEPNAETDTEHSDSCITGSDKSTEINCDSCLAAFEMERVFKCMTCNDQLERIDSVKFNCECCIMPHVRRGHDILDHKSLKPAVCEAHKNLCSVYCSSCEEILCLNCLSKHGNHNIMTVTERASKVKSKVFELIADLDSFEKLVNGTQERLNKDKETRAKGYEKLVQDVSAEMDALKQKVLDRIRKDHKKTVKMEQESLENYGLLLKSQSELRELLSCSDGNMVDHFKAKNKQVDQVKYKEEELGLWQIKGLIYSVSEQTMQLVRKFAENFLRHIEVPRVDLIAQIETHYVYSTKSGQLYGVECEGNKLTVYKLKLEEHDDGVSMSKIMLGTHENDSPMKDMQVFFLMQNNSKAHILIKTSKVLRLFEVASKRFKDIKFNLQPSHIPLFFVAISEKNVAEFVYWDETKKVVRQTNKQQVEYKCDSLPRVMNSWHDNTYVLFINEENDVVEIETHRGYPLLSVIQASVHCVKDISCISHISHIRGRLLVIWSLSTRTLTFLRRSSYEELYSLSFSVPLGSVFNDFYGPVRFFELDLNLSFLVTAKTQNKRGHWIEKNVFMIKTS